MKKIFIITCLSVLFSVHGKTQDLSGVVGAGLATISGGDSWDLSPGGALGFPSLV